jgi:hypothetical protein
MNKTSHDDAQVFLKLLTHICACSAKVLNRKARMAVPKFASRQLVFSGLILGRMMVCLDAESAV